MRLLRLCTALILALVLVIPLAGCGDDDIAAIVNGEEITLTELNSQVDQLIEQYPQMFEGPDGEGRLIDFKQRLLDNLINNILIRQAAEDEGVTVSDSEVEAQIEELKAGFPTEEDYVAALESAGMDADALDEQLKDQLILERLLEKLTSEIEITSDAMEEYYAGNQEQFTQEAAVHARHILFASEDEAQAEEVLADLRAGGDFAAAATEYSIDTVSAADGGDLGWPTMAYVAEFQEAADALEIGEISDLVQTTFGYHIIEVLERREASVQTLDDVRDQIEEILIQQANADAYQIYLDDIRAEAEIEILVEDLGLTSSGIEE
ncbi:MAG: peptidylprolyl isomerase [Actinomycetota bacterium]|jgi:foldase protein PrsA|nr:peptidylprolyl isomerase [Actinomycetota bacterium]